MENRRKRGCPFSKGQMSNYHIFSTKNPSQISYVCATLTHKKLSLPKANINTTKGYYLKQFFRKGMSPLFSVKGSMTVEASLLLPLFLFFFLNLFSVMEMYRLHSMLTAALRETGREMSVYAYAYKDLIGDEIKDEEILSKIENVAFSNLYVKAGVEKFCGKEYLDHSPLKNGSAEPNYLFSSILDKDDIIDLVAVYRTVPFPGFPGYFPQLQFARYFGRAFTGYEVDTDAKELNQYVYVAENGEVFHEDRNCSYLSLKIVSCYFADMEKYRNADGSKYYPCEKCYKSGKELLFISKYGNRYHEDRNCSGLKRVVLVVPRNEALKKLPACKKCKG